MNKAATPGRLTEKKYKIRDLVLNTNETNNVNSLINDGQDKTLHSCTANWL